MAELGRFSGVITLISFKWLSCGPTSELHNIKLTLVYRKITLQNHATKESYNQYLFVLQTFIR